MKKIVLAILILTTFFGTIFAQEEIKTSLFDELATPDCATNATIIIYQNEELKQRIEAEKTTSSETTGKGFRVQLFSGNNSQESQSQAFKIEQELLKKFPNLDVYVIYAAPFWKVRVGNCTTHEQALQLRDRLLEELKGYQTSMYIVPDQIVLK